MMEMSIYSTSSNAQPRIVKLANAARCIAVGRAMVKYASRFNTAELQRINAYQNALVQGVRQEHGFDTNAQAVEYLRGRGRWYDTNHEPADFKPNARLLNIASGKRGIGDIKWLKKNRSSQPLNDVQRQRIDEYSRRLLSRHMSRFDTSYMAEPTYGMQKNIARMGYQSRNLWYHPEYVAPTSDKRFWDIANGRVKAYDANTEALSQWDPKTEGTFAK